MDRPPAEEISPVDKHYAKALRRLRGNKRADQIDRALYLIGEALFNAPRAWTVTGPNDFAAIACLTRAFHQLNACMHLLMAGYYSEIDTVLRAAFEAAGLSRFLAHQPEMAEKWVKGEWFPDRQVRAWFGNEELYAGWYKTLSAGAHPTAMPTLMVINLGIRGYSARLEPKFSRRWFDISLYKVVSTALFVCMALRNAAAREEAFPPEWREALVKLAKDIAPEESWAQLERDWEVEQKKWAELSQKIKSAKEVEGMIREDPRSLPNLLGKPKTNSE